MLLGRVAVRQIAARDDELGGELGDERAKIVFDLGLFERARMEV
jgi:hypothetical protein